MHGFFLFRFNTEEDCYKVLEGGPWLIEGRVMILRKLQRGMDARKDLLEMVPLWGSFTQLGLHLWSQRMISRIASTIGKPLYIYQPTTSKSRLAYTRVCIEVNPHN